MKQSAPLLLAVMLVGLWAPVSRAQRRPTAAEIAKAQAYVDRGDALFDEKKFDLAIAEYTAALVIAPHPDLVWNIARACEELGQWMPALALFEKYKTMKVSKADQAAADKRIAALRQGLERAAKGVLVVATPDARARVRVGGVDVGHGREVRIELKPDRYRVLVELEGHQTYEAVVKVRGDATTRISATLAPIGKATLLVIATDRVGEPVSGARCSVDGAPEVPAGTAIQLTAGEHTLVLTAPGREDTKKELTLSDGQRLELKVPVGGLAVGHRFDSWQGTFRGLPAAAGELREQLGGGLLEVDANKNATLRVSRERALKRWRRKACGGAARVTWTSEYRGSVTEKGARLRLALSKVTVVDCSCKAWCEVESEVSTDARSLPGREGFLLPGVVFLREELRAGATQGFVKVPRPAQLAGEWRHSADVLRIGANLRGLFRTSRAGMIPSFRRGRCGHKKQYAQALEYPVTTRIRSGAVELSYGEAKEISCSCEGACGAPPRLAPSAVRLLIYPRYLFGPDVLMRREPGR